MTTDEKKSRCLVMLSGGLDSQLAVCVLRAQGIDVHGITFESPFFDAANARRAAGALGIPLHVEEFTAEIVALVEHPRHGFGAGMNPCIDCHTAMLRRAGQKMETLGFQFLATGEVLDQRPMSQNRRCLDLIARESGYGDRIVRPLSAQRLDETEPERCGWVDRSLLLDLFGRSRHRQFELAKHYGIADYPTPAGGCRLTEPNFAARLRELKKHEGLKDLRAIRLLRVGRHFRLGPQTKLIVGRNEADNHALEQAATEDDGMLQLVDIRGPVAMLAAAATREEMLLAAAICARYGDGPKDQPASVRFCRAGREEVLPVLAATEAVAEAWRIG